MQRQSMTCRLPNHYFAYCTRGGPVGAKGTLSGTGTGTFLPFSGVDEQSRSLGTAKTDPRRQDELRVVCLSLPALFN